MSSVAEQLRKAREAQHMDLSQVAEITKIRSDHLGALEEGNFEVFPAPVYVRGSVRTYATLLKLDLPPLMAALDAELRQNKVFSEPTPLSQEPRGFTDFLMFQLSKMDLKKTVWAASGAVGLLAITSGYFIWRHHRSVDPLKDLKPGLYQSNESLSGQTLPLPAPRR
jgi:cytoskeletal protein RodZ